MHIHYLYPASIIHQNPRFIDNTKESYRLCISYLLTTYPLACFIPTGITARYYVSNRFHSITIC